MATALRTKVDSVLLTTRGIMYEQSSHEAQKISKKRKVEAKEAWLNKSFRRQWTKMQDYTDLGKHLPNLVEIGYMKEI